MEDTYIKWLNKGHKSPYQGFRWKPGEWVEAHGKLVGCQNGIHVTGLYESFDWFSDEAWLVEVDGESFWHEESKLVCRRARLVERLPWDERIARLFAVDCAEHVLANFVQQYPHDPRPLQAIATARRFADGKASVVKLNAAQSAARYAARSVTRSVTRYAAESAARSAAPSAANNAAQYAAQYAAESAGWSAAESAKSAAQSTARYATWSAADSTARSAAPSPTNNKARYATWSAAQSAIRSAGRSAERQWQADLLGKTLGIESYIPKEGG